MKLDLRNPISCFSHFNLMKRQPEISLAGTTFPSQSAGRRRAFVFAPSLSSVPGLVWHWRYNTKKKARCSLWHYRVVLHSWHSPQIRRGGSKLARNPTKGNMKGEKKTCSEVAMRPLWTLILDPNSDYVSGKQFALEWDISDNDVSVDRRGGKVSSRPCERNPLFPPLQRGLFSKVWIL